jgi:flavodoxin I
MKALVVFGSTTGTTRILAQSVRKGLQMAGHDVTIRNAKLQDPREIDRFELLVMGCSTWENGELQKDFHNFFQSLENHDLSRHTACVFGPGHSSYRQFCHAVDILESKLTEKGVKLLVPSLKVDGGPYTAREGALQWARAIPLSSI